jgi:hypothetical protein
LAKGFAVTWFDLQEQLAQIAKLQLFFVGGAPRSGTTWLQQMLDAHPEVSCRGEALLQRHLGEPLEALMAARGKALTAKNTALFQHTGGYPLPQPEDTEHLFGTGVLLALLRQGAGRNCRAIGEKTPEIVFHFARLKKLFPQAKCIGIARDPRDVLASAWCFFNKNADAAGKLDFIRSAMPSLHQGAEAMLALSQEFPTDYTMVTYEALLAAPEATLPHLFGFLGVASDARIVTSCLTQTSFATQTGGRPPGAAHNGTFLRNGRAGDWQSVLTAEMNEMVLEKLGWMFPHFGWAA